jgi:zinc-ribbon domain
MVVVAVVVFLPLRRVMAKRNINVVGGRGEQELAKLAQTVQQHVAAGHQAFFVSLYCMADGVGMRKIERMREAGQQRLLDMGMDVTGMNYEESKYTVHFQVQVPQRRERDKRCPRCAETFEAGAVFCRYCGSVLSNG